jgi:ATP-dependent DNA ligase
VRKAVCPEGGVSSALIGAGTALYQAVVAGGQEAVMAKQLTSVYWPGKRSMTWKKINDFLCPWNCVR